MMNPESFKRNWCVRCLSATRMIPIMIGIALLPIRGLACQEPTSGATCKQTMRETWDTRTTRADEYSMEELEKHPEDYYGKLVTVDGELHQTFSDKVFTIVDRGFFRDRDILVISSVPKTEAVIPLEESLEPGKNVRVTGVVQPYDSVKLECAYGPLHLESTEGHSFTKNPVLIIRQTRTTSFEVPPIPRVKLENLSLVIATPKIDVVEALYERLGNVTVKRSMNNEQRKCSCSTAGFCSDMLNIVKWHLHCSLFTDHLTVTLQGLGRSQAL
jgi:hypothetical protein